MHHRMLIKSMRVVLDLNLVELILGEIQLNSRKLFHDNWSGRIDERFKLSFQRIEFELSYHQSKSGSDASYRYSGKKILLVLTTSGDLTSAF